MLSCCSFSCNCTETGFEGDLCENNIDECVSAPCMYGGNCTDLIKVRVWNHMGTSYLLSVSESFKYIAAC